MQNLIEIASRKILDEFLAIPYIGSELEFYLIDNDDSHSICLAEILKIMAENKVHVIKLEEESGHNQYEIAIAPIANAGIAAKQLSFLRQTVIDVAKKYNIKACFDAKPFEDQPGSALHINLSLLNSDGQNLFAKKLDEVETLIMTYSIGGLLETMLVNMTHFAPHDVSYLRYTAKKNEDVPEEKPARAYNNAPVNVSWGSNNRTTAIRIPSSTLHSESRHIEHRVSGADADPEMVILKILEGIYYGIFNQITPPDKIFGNAFDSQYSFLLPLPKTLDEALKIKESKSEE